MLSEAIGLKGGRVCGPAQREQGVQKSSQPLPAQNSHSVGNLPQVSVCYIDSWGGGFFTFIQGKEVKGKKLSRTAQPGTLGEQADQAKEQEPTLGEEGVEGWDRHLRQLGLKPETTHIFR